MSKRRKAKSKVRAKQHKNKGRKGNPVAKVVRSERFLPKVEKDKKKFKRKPKHKKETDDE